MNFLLYSNTAFHPALLSFLGEAAKLHYDQFIQTSHSTVEFLASKCRARLDSIAHIHRFVQSSRHLSFSIHS